MEQAYRFSSDQWQNLDIDAWTQESFTLSKTNVYPGIKEGQPLPHDYIAKNQDAIQKQIVLGGLRLSYVIQHIFGGREQSFLN